MGYQTPWVAHGHDIAFLKPQKTYLSRRSFSEDGSMPTCHGGESVQKRVSETEARFAKLKCFSGALKMSRIYNLLIL